jgi:hypothetical protein
MKYSHSQALCAAVFIFLNTVGSAWCATDTNPPPRLTVELKDGSRVVGISAAQDFRFHSALLGKLKLEVKDLRAIECGASNTATLTTAGGDKLTVWFADTAMAVKTSFGKVELPVDSVRRIKVSPGGTAGAAELINIDFGSGGARGYSLKTGAAALGEAGDFWNFYDRDASPAPNDWRRSGTLTNLKQADGEATPVGMDVSNAAGAWNDESTDPMYKTFDYPLNSGDNNVVTFRNLHPGEYDLLAYAPDGNFEVTVGGTSYGAKRNHDAPVSSVPVWTEGVQYSCWRHIKVEDGETLVLTVRGSDSANHALLSGIQIIASLGD